MDEFETEVTFPEGWDGLRRDMDRKKSKKKTEEIKEGCMPFVPGTRLSSPPPRLLPRYFKNPSDSENFFSEPFIHP